MMRRHIKIWKQEDTFSHHGKWHWLCPIHRLTGCGQCASERDVEREVNRHLAKYHQASSVEA